MSHINLVNPSTKETSSNLILIQTSEDTAEFIADMRETSMTLHQIVMKFFHRHCAKTHVPLSLPFGNDTRYMFTISGHTTSYLQNS